jgi:two-component sensor histidine kinase
VRRRLLCGSPLPRPNFGNGAKDLRSGGKGVGLRGDRLRRLVTIDLPRRLARRLPTPVTELFVGLGITALAVLLRLLAEPWIGDLVPFSLTFIAVVLAATLAGWRAGLVALVVGNLLVWYFVLPSQRSFELASPAAAWALALATVSELLILLIVALYQREVRRAELLRTRRIGFLSQALREMDHRTKNNFQIVTSLLLLQANRSASAEVKAALGEAAERLKAVAAVYDGLALSGEGLADVRLQDQLEEMCGQIRNGILPEGVSLTTELEPMVVPHETAVSIGVVVNELITNACKHAFPDHRGSIRVRTSKEGEHARIEVADDGRGFIPGARGQGGLGSRLIGAFVQRLKGRSEVRSAPGEGTVHAVLVPL